MKQISRSHKQFSTEWVVSACVLALAVLPADAQVAYFLVAPCTPDLKDSYVLPVTKLDDIAQARREATLDCTNKHIVVARIAVGADGINRDHLAPGTRMWTWHVTEFLAFAEGVAEILDGTPTLTEQRLTCWDRTESGAIGTTGTIGFVPYGVGVELTGEQIFFASAQVTTDGVKLHWLDLGTNYVYTVESSNSFNPVTWLPAVAGSWPTATTDWTDTALPRSGPRFYRVKAEKLVAP